MIKDMKCELNIFKKHKFKCSCGKVHQLPIEEIIIRNNALENLEQIKTRFNLGENVLVITDQNIYQIIGLRLNNLLEAGGFKVKKSVFKSNNLVADEKAIVKILNDITVDIDFFIAAGSGTINDLTRYISFKTKRPYISIPTSPSMDGYTANVSLLINNGYKKTFKANCPIAIYADTKMLKNAPISSISAGFGELIAKYTACADWLLSNIINGEYYCDFTHKTVLEYIDRCFESISDINSRNEKDILLLTKGLMISGIAMNWVGSSRPTAGAEHHISHFWEMKDMQLGNTDYLHGLKVSFGTLIMCKVYEELLNIDFREYKNSKKTITRDEWKSNIEGIYGDASEEIIMENYDKSFSEKYWQKQRERIIGKSGEWQKMVKTILPESKKLKERIYAFGGIVSPVQLGIDEKTFKDSLIYCKDLRSKFTVLEVLDYLGLLENIAGKVAFEMASEE